MTVRLVLVEDHLMLLDTMAGSIEQHDEIEVVGIARSVSEAIELLGTVSADVVVADYQLDDGLGTELVRRAGTVDPPVPVLLITGSDTGAALAAALEAGCAGFVSKSDGFGRLVDAVIAVAGGAAVFPAALFSQTLDRRVSRAHGLSSRELEVLQLLARAHNVQEIADLLYLSIHTVRNHVKQVLMKLDARSQLEAVVIGAREGLVVIG